MCGLSSTRHGRPLARPEQPLVIFLLLAFFLLVLPIFVEIADGDEFVLDSRRVFFVFFEQVSTLVFTGKFRDGAAVKEAGF